VCARTCRQFLLCRLFICVECCCPLHALLLLTMGAADDASTPDTHPYATAEYWDKVGLPGPWSRGFVDSIFNPLTVLCRGGVSGRPTLWKHATIANPPPRLPLGGLLEMCGYRMQRYRERREESDGERCSIFEWYIRWSVLKEPLSKLIKLQDRLLHLGCGSSALGEDMYRDGYSNAHNVDCSSTIIDSMRQRCAHMPVKTHPLGSPPPGPVASSLTPVPEDPWRRTPPPAAASSCTPPPPAAARARISQPCCACGLQAMTWEVEDCRAMSCADDTYDVVLDKGRAHITAMQKS
jgi:hypothetical protein